MLHLDGRFVGAVLWSGGALTVWAGRLRYIGGRRDEPALRVAQWVPYRNQIR